MHLSTLYFEWKDDFQNGSTSICATTSLRFVAATAQNVLMHALQNTGFNQEFGNLSLAIDMSHNQYNVSLPQCIVLSNLAAVSCVYHKDTCTLL